MFMDPNEITLLLTIREMLTNHHRLSALRTLVDQELRDIEAQAEQKRRNRAHG
jgi:hypothetical protein